MKRLLVLTSSMAVAAAATLASLFNRNSCDPCSTGMGMGGMSTMGAPSGGILGRPRGNRRGYLPTPKPEKPRLSACRRAPGVSAACLRCVTGRCKLKKVRISVPPSPVERIAREVVAPS